jgi:hypothetical protein
MVAFAIPPLALVGALGFVTRANANWAAPSFISAVVVVAALLIRRDLWIWLKASIAIGMVAQVLLLVTDAVATRLTVPVLANGDVYHRTLGWRVLGERVGALARLAEARTIVAEQRDAAASLLYYWRDQPEPVLAWPKGAVPDHHFELTRALTEAAAEPILFISRCGDERRLEKQFASHERIAVLNIPTGRTSSVTYYGFKLEGLRPPLRPLVGYC